MRDTYDAGDALVIVTTDRLSAFDRRLAAIPFKARGGGSGVGGAAQPTHHTLHRARSPPSSPLHSPRPPPAPNQINPSTRQGRVLNLTSAWWMRRAAAVAPHALLATPHPNVSIMTKCAVFPVEFVVRGFLTGSTDTSLWTHYARGEREYCGNAFPDGMRKNDR